MFEASKGTLTQTLTLGNLGTPEESLCECIVNISPIYGVSNECLYIFKIISISDLRTAIRVQPKDNGFIF